MVEQMRAGEDVLEADEGEEMVWYSVYGSWRRGEQLWLQTFGGGPAGGYIIDYTTRPRAVFRWYQISDEEPVITPLPEGVCLLYRDIPDIEPEAHIGEFTVEQVESMDLEALDYMYATELLIELYEDICEDDPNDTHNDTPNGTHNDNQGQPSATSSQQPSATSSQQPSAPSSQDGHNVLRLRGGGESSEDSSSEEEDDVSDIEITEKFDEVVFGDGDESHQIYTNMNGVTITWNTCTEDTFDVLREELADMFGVDPQAFYITHNAKYIRDEFRARDLPNGACVSVNFRIRGGGKRAATSSLSKDIKDREKEKEKEQAKRIAMMAIEEGAKNFVPTHVDKEVDQLANKLKRLTESDIGNLLLNEMGQRTALELTLLKDDYSLAKNTTTRMGVVMYALLPETNVIRQKIEQLKGILETTQLTVSQIYEEEFGGHGHGGSETSFSKQLSKIISHKLGAQQQPDEQPKKARF